MKEKVGKKMKMGSKKFNKIFWKLTTLQDIEFGHSVEEVVLALGDLLGSGKTILLNDCRT